MRRLWLSAVAAGVTALPVAAAAAQGVFVSPAEVRSMQASGRLVRVLDVGRTHEQWNAAHIAGSIEFALSWVVVTRDGIPNELPPVAVLDSVFEHWGIGDSTLVVVHGEPLAAARVWATAMVTSAMLRTWSVRFDAIEFTLSVRSFQVPATPGTAA